ncbi:hypothetical protein X777_03543 [Ooceraea biroi]|uniref:Mos1 transposase HTH domain-containing protein n=1 Tax=Ooceraea biroi TaxID=2015173 RepID=A0A026WKM8_OOCBI|nr:hypothetical protein X777_03543 [Ooceraea biroi]
MSQCNLNRIQICECIIYYYKRDKSAENTTSLICQEYRRNVLPLSICKMWFKKFESGDYNDYYSTSNANRSEVEVLYNEDRFQSHWKIAEQLGIHRTTVSKHLKALRENGQIERQVTTRSQVEELYNKDPSQSRRKIADTLVLSERTVLKHLKALRENGQIERPVTTVRTQVEELYNADRSQTHQTIAERLGTPPSTVLYHMKIIKERERRTN